MELLSRVFACAQGGAFALGGDDAGAIAPERSYGGGGVVGTLNNGRLDRSPGATTGMSQPSGPGTGVRAVSRKPAE